jgi:hypothetical protein
MTPEEKGYRSFLLRMWCVKQNHQIAWRASLQDPRTGEQVFFYTREALDKYLCELREELERELDIEVGD